MRFLQPGNERGKVVVQDEALFADAFTAPELQRRHDATGLNKLVCSKFCIRIPYLD
jgi:hypothetical protein